MQVCAHVVMCGSDKNYFGPNKISKCGHFYTLHVYSVITKVIFLISVLVGLFTVLTQTILIGYEFSSVTVFVSRQKNDIFDEIRSKLRLCVQNNVKY